MNKLTFLLSLLCLSLDAQVTVREGTQSVVPIGGGGGNIVTTNTPQVGQVLFTAGPGIYYWDYATNAPSTNVVLTAGQIVKGAGSTTTVIAPRVIGSTNMALQSVDATNIVNNTITSNQLAQQTIDLSNLTPSATNWLLLVASNSSWILSQNNSNYTVKLTGNTTNEVTRQISLLVLTNVVVIQGTNGIQVLTNIVGGVAQYTIGFTGSSGGGGGSVTNWANAAGADILLTTNTSGGNTTITIAVNPVLTNITSIAFSNGSQISGVTDTNTVKWLNPGGNPVEVINTNGAAYWGTNNQAVLDISGNLTINGKLFATTARFSSLTATTILGLNGSKDLVSAALSGLTWDGTTLTATGGGGSLPAGTNQGDLLVYNTSSNAFLSYPIGQYYGIGSTTNATATNLITLVLLTNKTARITGDFTAAGATNSGSWSLSALFRNDAGVITAVQTNMDNTLTNSKSAGWKVLYLPSGSTNIFVQAIGDSVESVNWAYQGLFEQRTNGITVVVVSSSSLLMQSGSFVLMSDNSSKVKLQQ